MLDSALTLATLASSPSFFPTYSFNCLLMCRSISFTAQPPYQVLYAVPDTPAAHSLMR